MASLMSFGELNIPGSRAFWDDEEEETGEQKPVEKLQLKFVEGQSDKVVPVDTMLIFEGLHILEFAQKSLLLQSTKISDLPSKNSTLNMLKVNGKELLIAIIEEDLNVSGELTQLLIPYAQEARQVVTINIKPKVDFKSENIAKVREEITFLRGINSPFNHIKELAAPNFIAGVSAGIASCRQGTGNPTSSYIAYTDNVALDSLAAQPIIKLLKQDLKLPCADSYVPKSKDDTYLYS